MTYGFQTTIADRVSFDGIGVHSGKPVSMTLHPADADNGITFLRTNLDGGREREIEAHHTSVIDTRLCTVIGEAQRASVGTIEHLMSALSGLGIDNVVVEIDGAEVPIMDGSARAFVEGIDQVGIETLRGERRFIKVLKPVRVEMGRAFAEFRPHDEGFRLDVTIDFDCCAIGRQRRRFDLDPVAFRRDIARARTFGFVKDVEALWKAGLALGSSLENSVAIDNDRVINPEGLRWSDEFVRHKTLDAVGDLALSGAPILGLFRSYCGGHRLNHMALEALLSDSSAFAIVEPPARRERGYGELTPGMGVPAFAPEAS